MAYFNHAFQKTILAVDGLITDTSKKMWDVNSASVSDAGVQQAKIALIGTEGSNKDKVLNASAVGYTQQPFVIAGSTLRPIDKLGKFAGGYQALNLSKKINPKYVNKLYVVLPQAAQSAVAYVGNVTIGATQYSTCSETFTCGKNYYLQVNVKGNSIASTLMHNYFRRVPGYVSCCGNESETGAVGKGGVEMYYSWAKYLKEDPIVENFIDVFVSVKDGNTWKLYSKTGSTSVSGYDITGDFNALETLIAGNTITSAGLIIVAAYEQTKFGTCTFDKLEADELQPLELYVDRVDVEGNPCFDACKPTVVPGVVATRTKRSIINELILDESYHQRFFSDDLRKREIEGSGQMLNMISQEQLPGIYLLHSIPRFSNPTSTFDNDQYLIQIVTTGSATIAGSTVTLTGTLGTITSAIEAATGLTAEVFVK